MLYSIQCKTTKKIASNLGNKSKGVDNPFYFYYNRGIFMLSKEEFLNQNKQQLAVKFIDTNQSVWADFAEQEYQNYVANQRVKEAKPGDNIETTYGIKFTKVFSVGAIETVTREYATFSVVLGDENKQVAGKIKIKVDDLCQRS